MSLSTSSSAPFPSVDWDPTVRFGPLKVTLVTKSRCPLFRFLFSSARFPFFQRPPSARSAHSQAHKRCLCLFSSCNFSCITLGMKKSDLHRFHHPRLFFFHRHCLIDPNPIVLHFLNFHHFFFSPSSVRPSIHWLIFLSYHPLETSHFFTPVHIHPLPPIPLPLDSLSRRSAWSSRAHRAEAARPVGTQPNNTPVSWMVVLPAIAVGCELAFPQCQGVAGPAQPVIRLSSGKPHHHITLLHTIFDP